MEIDIPRMIDGFSGTVLQFNEKGNSRKGGVISHVCDFKQMKFELMFRDLRTDVK